MGSSFPPRRHGPTGLALLLAVAAAAVLAFLAGSLMRRRAGSRRDGATS